MLRHALLAAALLATVVVGPAFAAPILFTASLTGAAESPPNLSPATGSTLVTIDPVAHTLEVFVTFAGLLGPNTAAHIHVINGPGDANILDTVGPVATTTPTFPGFPTGATSGTYFNTFDTLLSSTYRAGWITDSGGTTALAEAALFDGIMTGRAYLNIHSSVFPAGEIRGFLLPAAVPEPSALLLLGTGVAGILVRRRR